MSEILVTSLMSFFGERYDVHGYKYVYLKNKISESSFYYVPPIEQDPN